MAVPKTTTPFSKLCYEINGNSIVQSKIDVGMGLLV